MSTAARNVVLAVIETAAPAGVSREEALQAYLEEVAFTLLDRLVTFRCLEERGLVLVGGQAETLVRRDPVRGTSSLVWRTRDANRDLDERAIARAAYRTACAAMTERVKVLFDPDDEASALFPTLPLWQKAIDAFNDPAIPSEVFAEDEIMGWVYQYWSTELKNEVYAKLAKGGKIEDPSELAAATALYTERYIVDYLVQNTLGATWVEMHPESGLPATWPYYVTTARGQPAGRARAQACPRPHAHRPLRRLRPLPRARLRAVRPALCGGGDRATRATSRASSSSATSTAPTSTAGPSRSPRSPSTSRAARLAGADFRPRKLNLVACDIAIPPAPPAEFIESLEEPELKELAQSLWTGTRRDPHLRLAAPSRARRQRGVREAQGPGQGHALGRRHRLGEEARPLHDRAAQAFTAAAGDTDLSTRLFGEEAARGLDALQILGRRYDVVVTNPPYQTRAGA